MGRLVARVAGIFPNSQMAVDLFEGGVVGAVFHYPSWAMDPLCFEIVAQKDNDFLLRLHPAIPYSRVVRD